MTVMSEWLADCSTRARLRPGKRGHQEYSLVISGNAVTVYGGYDFLLVASSKFVSYLMRLKVTAVSSKQMKCNKILNYSESLVVIVTENNKNSSGVGIANVNAFTTISHTYLKIPKQTTYFC